MRIRIAGIIKESIVDGPGIRYTIFTQGCHHKCFGCHNPETHDPDGGYYKEINDILSEIKNNPLLSGVTLSGGEPFLQTEECYELIKNLDDHLDIILYTGYTFEYLMNKSSKDSILYKILNKIDYLIDGKYDALLKSLDLQYRGSCNQRIIDVKESLLSKKIIIKEF